MAIQNAGLPAEGPPLQGSQLGPSPRRVWMTPMHQQQTSHLKGGARTGSMPFRMALSAACCARWMRQALRATKGPEAEGAHAEVRSLRTLAAPPPSYPEAQAMRPSVLAARYHKCQHFRSSDPWGRRFQSSVLWHPLLLMLCFWLCLLGWHPMMGSVLVAGLTRCWELAQL